MTIEEAIAHGREQLDVFGGEHAEFIKLSIEALEKQIPKKTKRNEEIRKKAIECGESYQKMCAASLKKGLINICTCEYQDINRRCDVVYGYEHGFADGVEEGKKQARAWMPFPEPFKEG